MDISLCWLRECTGIILIVLMSLRFSVNCSDLAWGLQTTLCMTLQRDSSSSCSALPGCAPQKQGRSWTLCRHKVKTFDLQTGEGENVSHSHSSEARPGKTMDSFSWNGRESHNSVYQTQNISPEEQTNEEFNGRHLPQRKPMTTKCKFFHTSFFSPEVHRILI